MDGPLLLQPRRTLSSAATVRADLLTRLRCQPEPPFLNTADRVGLTLRTERLRDRAADGLTEHVLMLAGYDPERAHLLLATLGDEDGATMLAVIIAESMVSHFATRSALACLPEWVAT